MARRYSAVPTAPATARLPAVSPKPGRPVSAGRREQVLHAGPGPVRARVVTAAPGVGSARAERGTPHVDDRRVIPPDIGEVDPQLTAGVGADVGHEDIGGRHQGGEHIPPGRVFEVDGHRPLASVGRLEERVHASVDVVQAVRRQAPIRIAGGRLLDLDDLRAPLAKHRPGQRHEDVRGHLDHPHASQRRAARRLLAAGSRLVAWGRRRPRRQFLAGGSRLFTVPAASWSANGVAPSGRYLERVFVHLP
jgi:hypothetical protein